MIFLYQLSLFCSLAFGGGSHSLANPPIVQEQLLLFAFSHHKVEFYDLIIVTKIP